MSNREKIISAIEKAKKQSEENAQDAIIVPFKEVNMIIALLKEQEAVKIEVKKINDNGRCGRCPNCLIELNEMDYPNYCGFCGRLLKWK